MDRVMSNDGVLGVGVVGAGAMGAAHVRTLTRWISGARVTSVYDADPTRATQVAAAVGAVAAGSVDDVIGSDQVDAVLIAAPDPSHEQMVLACLSAEKPVLCEKPLATNVEGSRRIVRAEVAGGRRLVQVGFMRRFDPAHNELRASVAGGEVGAVRMVHCIHRNGRAHPSATSEGIIGNSMIHELDIVSWLLHDSVTAVTIAVPRLPEGALLDPQLAVLETAAGTLVTVEVFVNARYGYDVQCEVVGDKGTVSLSPPAAVRFRRQGTDGLAVAADFVHRFADAYRIELDAWVEAVRSGRPIGPSAWDGHRANLVAAAGVESLRTRTRVAVATDDIPSFYT
ncbi:MAG: Gfo/Idh/MocA family protein [Nocardioidaceae bacterium]